MMWFDSHCHLQRFSNRGDLEVVLEDAERASVSKLVAIGTSREDWEIYRSICTENKTSILYTIGLHPSYVDSNWKDQVEMIPAFWRQAPLPVAVGEVGLDYFRLPKCQQDAKSNIQFQKQAFELQLQIAADLDSPVVIHSRSAFEDCVQMIDQSKVAWSKVVFHCFSGTMEQMSKINERGGWISFTGILSYGANQELREVFKQCNLDRVMLETDSPYLAPVPKRGQENTPAYLAFLGSFAAKILGMDELEFAKKIYANSEEFYGCQSLHEFD